MLPNTQSNVVSATTQKDEQDVWLAVQINRSGPMEPVLLLRLADGRLLASGEDLKRWRLNLPASVARSHDDRGFYALDALAGLTYSVDEPHQVLFIDAPAALFSGTVLQGQATRFSAPAPPPAGAFFNYDLSSANNAGHNQTSGLFEFGIFNSRGVGTSSFLARDYGSEAGVIRLDTAWTQDRPAELASMHIGDSISAAGDWGRSVRFGGIQWATDFATQPGFVPFPLPSFAGEAVLPSTADLFVDNALRMARDVPSGPFNILDLPVVNGSGVATVVVRDLLGREQAVSLPYYVSPRLLQAGLNDYSYEAGFIRDNYGIASNDYGRFMAAGTERHGFSDWLTGDVHAEVLHDQQTAGVGGTFLLPSAGVFSASLAGSHDTRLGNGRLMGVGFERQTGQLSFGGSIQFMTAHFVELGLAPGTLAPRQLGQAFVSLATTGYGSLGLNYTLQNNRSEASVRLAGANYNLSLRKLGYLNFSAVRILGASAATTYSLTFTRPLDERTSASASLSHAADGNQAQIDVQRNLPADDGFGYRLQAGADSHVDANVTLQSATGTYSLDAERLQGRTSLRADIGGGMVWFGGDTFLSRRIDQSFGVIEVPGYPNVHIYADNQPVAITNADGNALVPRLRAYQDNPIRIEQADLPLDAEVDALQLQAVPFLRSGVLLTFPVRRSLGALIAIILDNGQPLPAGAVVQIVGQPREFPTGMNGEAYLTGLMPSNRLSASWRGQHCEFEVLFPSTSEPLPNLGSYRCTGVTP